MPRTFYTIDDLAAFCRDNNFSHFSSKEHNNKPLIIQSVENFEVTDTSKDGLMPVKLKSCHIGLNRNQSCISEDVMNKYKSSFKGRPILGSIIKTETGEYEFHSHDYTINEDGEVEYQEQPVGVISEIEEPYLEYDKDEDKTYLMVKGNIFTDYSRAAEILERRKTCKCSVEIAVNEMSWNCDENYLSIDAFTFMGVTILGFEEDGVTEIQEGMKGSKITIDNFSVEQNSMFNANYSDKIVDLLSNIDKKLDNLSYNKINQEGGKAKVNHFEELLEKYGVKLEDIDFEYEEMSDEELDVKFAELFDDSGDGEPAGEPTNGEGEVEPASEEGEESEEQEVEPVAEVEPISEPEIEVEPVVVEVEPEVDPEVTDDGVPKKKKVENHEVKYELSHDDVRYALYELLNAQSDDGYYYTWIVEVYDDKFIYEDYETCKFYRQRYSKGDDSIALDGEAVEVFNEWLSKEEKDALDALKADYAELKSFKEQYELAELKAAKDAVFESPEYEEIKETAEFTALIEEADNYTVEELRVQADLIYAASMKKKFNFEVEQPVKNRSVSINLNTKSDKKKPYGRLFDK